MGLIFGSVGAVLIAAGALAISGVAPFTRLRGGTEMSDGEQRVFGAIYIALGIALGVAGVALALN